MKDRENSSRPDGKITCLRVLCIVSKYTPYSKKIKVLSVRRPEVFETFSLVRSGMLGAVISQQEAKRGDRLERALSLERKKH